MDLLFVCSLELAPMLLNLAPWCFSPGPPGSSQVQVNVSRCLFLALNNLTEAQHSGASVAQSLGLLWVLHLDGPVLNFFLAQENSGLG